MESWVRSVFLTTKLRRALPLLLLLLGMVPAQAQEQTGTELEGEPLIQPQLERREITEAMIDTEDFEIGAYFGVLSIEDFGSNAVYGGRVTYHVAESLFIEAAYGMSEGGKTSYELLSGSAQLLTDDEREYTYYNVALGYALLPGEVFWGEGRAFNSALYLIGGVGNTTFGGDDRFTINLGVGYRFLATDWLSLHLDMRDHMFDIDITGQDKTAHNIETTLGVAVFF